MEKFAVICLIVIFLTIQHILNWMWRKSNNETVVPFVFITAISAIISGIILYHIIIWSYPILITK